MNRKMINTLLKNYGRLLARVDAHIKQVETKYSNEIVCKKGCDSCCRFLNLFPVEAFSLATAFCQMDTGREQIMAGLEKGTGCPLLIKGQCSLYEARPIICRTHGYPLYFEKDGETLVDFCPKNFKGISCFPKESLFDLEQLNTILTAINKQFIESIETDFPLAERIPISDALGLLDKTDNITR
jgi:uncharacterized protein